MARAPSHHDVFWQDIHANPGDPTPRLVYADWLLDQGDEDSLARAEFIRGHHALEHWPEEDERRPEQVARLEQLLRDHARDWVRPFAALFRDLAYIGKYLGHVPHCLRGDGCLTLTMLSVVLFLAQRERPFQPSFLAPYVRLALDTSGPMEKQELDRLAQTPELEWLTEGTLYGYLSYSIHPAIDQPHLEALLESSHLRRLRRLTLCYNELRDEDALALVRCGSLERLSFLDLSHNHLTAAALEMLLTSPRLPRLAQLFCGGNTLSAAEQGELEARHGGRVRFVEADEE
jgi:uncharacterized protein (TIGR02996 family)